MKVHARNQSSGSKPWGCLQVLSIKSGFGYLHLRRDRQESKGRERTIARNKRGITTGGAGDILGHGPQIVCDTTHSWPHVTIVSDYRQEVDNEGYPV